MCRLEWAFDPLERAVRTAMLDSSSAPPTGTRAHRRRLRRAVAVGLAVLTVAAAAACGKADAGEKESPPKRGGTLRVVLGANVAHLDPQRIKNATEANLSRLT